MSGFVCAGIVPERRRIRPRDAVRVAALVLVQTWVLGRVSAHHERQEFVIGGYSNGRKTFDALVLGYFKVKRQRELPSVP
jgi:hypothetical protein